MECFGAFLTLVTIVLVAWVIRLSRQVAAPDPRLVELTRQLVQLEQRLGRLERRPGEVGPAADDLKDEEKNLATRAPIWLGAIALSLAGVFLVKYSFEQGWISPTIRVAIGILFGLGMLGGGELLRQKNARIGGRIWSRSPGSRRP